MKDDLDQYVGAYDDSFAYALDNDLMLNWYPQRIIDFDQGHSLLELGVGHGYTASRFAARYARYLIIEGSTKVIDSFLAKYCDLDVEIIKEFFENFSTDERFDVIVMGFVLEHMDNPLEILGHYRQFLAPGGSMYVAVPNCESLHRRFGAAAGLLEDISSLGAGDLALGHKRLYTVQSLQKLVEQAGYTPVRTEGLFLKPLTTNQLTQLELPESILQSMLKVGVAYPELCAGLLMEIKVS